MEYRQLSPEQLQVHSCPLLSSSCILCMQGCAACPWRSSFHCQLSAFSLNYLRQTSWLTAMQDAGSGLGRPRFGSPKLGSEKEKGNSIFSGAFPFLVFLVKINGVVDSWLWLVPCMLSFPDVNLQCLCFRLCVSGKAWCCHSPPGLHFIPMVAFVIQEGKQRSIFTPFSCVEEIFSFCRLMIVTKTNYIYVFFSKQQKWIKWYLCISEYFEMKNKKRKNKSSPALSCWDAVGNFSHSFPMTENDTFNLNVSIWGNT